MLAWKALDHILRGEATRINNLNRDIVEVPTTRMTWNLVFESEIDREVSKSPSRQPPDSRQSIGFSISPGFVLCTCVHYAKVPVVASELGPILRRSS